MKLYTGKALAETLGLTAGEVESLRKLGIVRFKTGKVYDPAEAAREIISYYRQKGQADETADYQTERAKLMQVKRRAAENELRTQEGELLVAAETEKEWTGVLINLRAKILAIPAKLTPKVAELKDKNSIYQELKTALEDALYELSDYDALLSEKETYDDDALLSGEETEAGEEAECGEES